MSKKSKKIFILKHRKEIISKQISDIESYVASRKKIKKQRLLKLAWWWILGFIIVGSFTLISMMWT